MIGNDRILGLGKSSFLSLQLITMLKEKNLIYLYQAKGKSRPGFISENWKTSEEFGLIGELASEWDGYCMEINGAGVQLHNFDDEIIWTGGDK
jgi:hypothetical protein